MSQFVETPTKYFTAGAALGVYLRVKLSAGKLAAAGLSDNELGTIENAAFASGDVRPVRLSSAQGTVKMVASGAITAGVAVYAAAAGKISATVGPVYIGIAFEAATANNDIIEVLRTAEPNLKTVVGQTTTASASDTVATGLNTVLAVVANLEDAPVLTCFMATANIGDQAGAPAAGSILIKTWKPTASGDATPIAATTFGKKVNWIAIGT